VFECLTRLCCCWQCDPHNCTAQNQLTSLACAEATCDLEAASLIQPLVKFYHGPRQFALYKAHPRASAKEVAPVPFSLSARGRSGSDNKMSSLRGWHLPCGTPMCSTCSQRQPQDRKGGGVPTKPHNCNLWGSVKNGYNLQPEIALLRPQDCSRAGGDDG
jgi:hypothetical protein